jgi:hypothetical protein
MEEIVKVGRAPTVCQMTCEVLFCAFPIVWLLTGSDSFTDKEFDHPRSKSSPLGF